VRIAEYQRHRNQPFLVLVLVLDHFRENEQEEEKANEDEDVDERWLRLCRTTLLPVFGIPHSALRIPHFRRGGG
jgi:hypothetical protein